MAEYIEREAAIRAVLNDSTEQVGYSREDAADCIRYIDAADVAPVRHGRWISKNPHGMELKPCPFCGKSVAHVDSIANHEMMDEHESNYSWSSTHYDVVCDYHNGGCGASTGKGNATPEEAIEAWNRRVSE